MSSHEETGGKPADVPDIEARSAETSPAVGRVFVNRFESGATFLNLQMEKAPAQLKLEIQKGREHLTKRRSEAKAVVAEAGP